MNKIFVYPKLPNAGLGNMLLVWAKAILFAEINSFPVIEPNWDKVRIGPLLRGEKYSRYYGEYFLKTASISRINGLIASLGATKIYEPSIEKVNILGKSRHRVYIFCTVPHWSNYFSEIKEHKSLIKTKLLANIHPRILFEINDRPSPEIGIHVRMGDFRKLQVGEDFSKVGSVRTPFYWYIDVIERIRSLVGKTIPATVFSDGYNHELTDLLKLPQVFMSPKASAISDMLTLSKSKLLITSAGSTFSGYASYLGNCPTIWHPDHFHSGVFSEKISKTTFEGGFNPKILEIPPLLERNIVSAFKNKILL
jgi:hypothetical protein